MKMFSAQIAIGCLIAGVGWSSNSAHAQSACITDCRDKGWAASQCNTYCASRYGEPDFSKRKTRVYGYSSKRQGSCGQYQYSKGGRCVDARTAPPKL